MEAVQFKVVDCKLDGLKLIEPFYQEDERGYFLKSFEQGIYERFGLQNEIAEDFESYSIKNVIRGLHFQTKNPQLKMVRVIQGSIMDVAVDLRKDSPAFGKSECVVLNAEKRNIFYIPAGFAHGFKVLSEGALVSYKCIGRYDSTSDGGIFWNDKDLEIPWDIKEEQAIVSDKDKALMSFQEFVRKSRYLVSSF